MKKYLPALLLILTIITLFGCNNSITGQVVRSELDENITLSDDLIQIRSELDLATTYLDTLKELNFSVVRYNDTLIATEELYWEQVTLETNEGEANYLLLNQKLNELKNIREKAYLAFDELGALKIRIDATTATNTTPIYELYNKSETAFHAERYEESLQLTEETYIKISEMEATETKVRAFYGATSRTFTNFLKNNLRNILIGVIILIIISIIIYSPTKKALIEHQIKKLEQRADGIKSLIAESQKDFFDKQTLNESTFHVRIKKYGELLRDIHRQIPLLKEKLAYHNFKKRKKGDLK